MRSEWDARARENAFHYVASGRETWTQEEFLESGRRSVQTLVLDDLRRICGDRDPKSLSMLEIGCGAGRMTAALADIFGEVDAIDVSPAMLERAAALLAGRPNVRLHLCDGASLPAMDGRRFDFILSYIVFQHIPDQAVVEAYVRQAAERLRPGCVFKFQAQGAEAAPGETPDTWQGAHLGAADAVRLAAETGCEIDAFEGLGEQYFWLWFRKLEQACSAGGAVELLLAETRRRERIAHALDEELQARTAWAQSLDQRTAALEDAVQRLQGELDTANAWALGLEAEAHESRTAVDERTAWAQERDRHAAFLAAELARERNELDERTRWAQRLESEVEERTQWARGLDAELEACRSRLAAIEGSLLYRLARRLRLV